MPVSFSFSVEELPVVEPLAEDVLEVVFERGVVVDAKFTDLTNYDIVVVSGTGDIAIRSVLAPTDSRVTNKIILRVDKPTEGTHYRVSVTGLSGRDGAVVGGSSDFIGRRTKGGDMIRSMPSHYDTRVGSILGAVLTAIGIEDDIIGGSRSDFFL
jgi:hypothetical protein